MVDATSTSVGPSQPESQAESPVTWWETFSFGVIHMVVAGSLRLLSLPGLYRIGRAFATLEWLVNFKRRRRYAAVLNRILSPRPDARRRRRLTREHFARTRCDKILYLILDCLDRNTAVSLFSIDNKELLDHALARGRGVCMALSHHGPHHVAAMLFAFCGYKIAGVRDRREGGIRRFVQGRFDERCADSQRMRVLFADSFPREIYRCYEDGFVVGSALDLVRIRDPKQKVQVVNLFGDTSWVLTGPLRVALRCGAPVLQGFLLSEPGFRYKLHIAEMLIDPEAIDDREAAIERAAHTYAANIERLVRATPALITRV